VRTPPTLVRTLGGVVLWLPVVDQAWRQQDDQAPREKNDRGNSDEASPIDAGVVGGRRDGRQGLLRAVIGRPFAAVSLLSGADYARCLAMLRFHQMMLAWL
jgi:hypothetical protein